MVVIVAIVILEATQFGFSLSSWDVVSSPNPHVNQWNELTAVACTSRTNCWAVGGANELASNPNTGNTQDRALIEHFNGVSWTMANAPGGTSEISNELYGIACPSAQDCWAVGGGIDHWNGTTWSLVSSPGQILLSGVTCPSATDCWAVGNGVDHWNGVDWSHVSSPSLSGALASLQAVTCVGDSDCWAVGSDCQSGCGQFGSVDRTITENYDGTSWKLVSSPNDNPDGAASNDLYGVVCVSTTDCLTVGDASALLSGSASLSERWDGKKWSIVNAGNPFFVPSFFASQSLSNLTCNSASNCWAVGSSIEHWNGTTWTIVGTPTNDGLSGVACPQANACWAVGAYSKNKNVDQTLILRLGHP